MPVSPIGLLRWQIYKKIHLQIIREDGFLKFMKNKLLAHANLIRVRYFFAVFTF